MISNSKIKTSSLKGIRKKKERKKVTYSNKKSKLTIGVRSIQL